MNSRRTSSVAALHLAPRNVGPPSPDRLGELKEASTPGLWGLGPRQHALLPGLWGDWRALRRGKAG